MEVDQIIIDSTVIKFFDDCITEDLNDVRKIEMNIVLANAMQSLKNIE